MVKHSKSPPLPASAEMDAGSSDLTGWTDPAARMRRALRDNELELFAQPIISLAPGTPTIMAEVFVRLREEEEMLLPPGEFFPVMEHYGMLPELDRWVVTHALEYLAQSGKDKYANLSLNVSGPTLGDPEFGPFIAAGLVRHAVAPATLCFEIDEIDTITRPEAAAQFAATARRIGCRVLLDGFGQRSVTFNALTDLKPHFVKADGVIVRKILDSEKALTKLMAILRFSRVNGIATIAECIESPEVLAKVKELGIGHAQGFGIARPQPIERAAQAS